MKWYSVLVKTIHATYEVRVQAVNSLEAIDKVETIVESDFHPNRTVEVMQAESIR
jgi:hypothetical protein